MDERILGKMKVRDIRKLIVEKASLIHPRESLQTLLQKIVEDHVSRHVYVIDDNDRLIGSVRLNVVLRHMFPLTAMSVLSQNRLSTLISSGFLKNIEEIMNSDPYSVQEDTEILDVVKIMIEGEINELPVVDSDRRVIGEINFLEIISAFLKTRQVTFYRPKGHLG